MDFKEEMSLAVGAADGKRPSVRLIRRSRLKEWLAGRSLAGTEKAYLTKLVKGECAFWGQTARQIENKHGMPKGHLDGPLWDEVAILGDRIKALRKGAGLTQKQLAEIVGVAQTTIATWECGKREMPRGHHLLRLARALGFDADELMGLAGDEPEDSIEEAQLLAAFRTLPKEKQLVAIKLVQALK